MLTRNLLLATLITLPVASAAAETTHIRSEKPAQRWEDAMLSGNGLTGVMQYGDPLDERLIFNSHRFVLPNGAPVPIPDMADAVEPMRDKMLAGKIGEGWADYYALLRERGNLPAMIWTQSFHPGYVLRIETPEAGEIRGYSRVTNYRTGEVIVRWTDERGDWRRRTFVSRADDVVVTELSAPTSAESFGCKLSVEAAEKHRGDVPHESYADSDSIGFRARYPKVGDRVGGYEGQTRVATVDGESHVSENQIEIKDATKVVLLTRLARYRDDYTEWEEGKLAKSLDEIEPNYDKLFAAHLLKHRPLFDRVKLQLDVKETDRSTSTEDLITRAAKNDPGATSALLEKLFASSRYLFICSAGKEYAPRLSGVFLGAWGAAWAGDYTCDANVNLAVIGGNTTDLPECMEGYFAILERTQPQWREAAKQLYGCRGILGPVRIDGEVAVPHHVNHYHAHLTATGLGPWLLFPMWEHYLVTGDKKFLRDRLYPLLREQAVFYEDFLTRRDTNGKYIFVPSNSPENAWAEVEPRTSASINSTQDIAAFKHNMQMLRDAESALEIEPDEDSKRWQAMTKDAPPYLLTKEGYLKEWAWPSYGENYNHRHSSHVYPVWPAGEISVDDPATRSLADAMVAALDRRKTKLVQAHDFLQKSIAYIRLKRADRFEPFLKHFLTEGYIFSSLATSHNSKQHIYNFDPILCVGGLMTEACVYTDPETIELLPALPEQMSVGTLDGLKGRNGVTIEHLGWDTNLGKLDCRLVSRTDQTLTLIHRKGIKRVMAKSASSDNEIAESPLGDFARKLRLRAGEFVEVQIEF